MNTFFEQPVSVTTPWLEGSGPAAEIVLSTRARLARNLSAFEFPHHAGEATRAEIQQELNTVLDQAPRLEDGWTLPLGTMGLEQQKVLREKFLVGSGDARDQDHRHLLVSATGLSTALINGEDHLRLSVYGSGFQPLLALESLMNWEADLDADLDFAYRDDFGYLTASPINAGTGLRLSVILHLPGLIMGGEIEKILNALRQLRFSVRGLFGQGGAVRGGIFLISNLVTLGRDEWEIAGDFEFHLGKVLLHERTARQQLFANDSLGIEDLAQRSLAVLQRARLMTAQEAFDRLSHLRLGVALGMLPSLDFSLLNEAMIRLQTGHLLFAAGIPCSVAQKTEARATLLRELFADS